ncbi:alpha/beta hydrolase [Beijerinckia indica]|uniref:Phospholipase/Carboxylesterase n=1 Tax=Beijerinckia indica subsp. indica (strain ATCC 9039 / DSM 1715 / NCIMB 8712) TaxID=395963 RepID=B2IIL6_BEII9|nr:phospholipase/carboxylesterase [Beijerinckia indica]ACB94709.1 phospholipase/Carboxylesterase [Beijerinckia indica subsp. indica ATCC 9039]
MAFSEPLETGADWADAKAVAILMHGHGQTPEDMRNLAVQIDCPQVRYLLPDVEGGLWYPKNLLEPYEENEPALKASLAYYGAIIDGLKARGVEQDRIVPGGYSQGACLTAEFLVRNPRTYGGALILTGGLIDVAAIGRRPGSGLLAVPIYVTGSEMDAIIPVDRVRGAIKTLQAGGALIRSHVFTDRAHEISADEILEARKLLEDVKKAAEPL